MAAIPEKSVGFGGVPPANAFPGSRVQNANHRPAVQGLFQNAFHRLLELDARWANVIVKLVGWWILIFSLLLLLFVAFSALKNLLVIIPPIIQFACAFLLVLAAALLVVMLRERRRVLDACRYFLDAFAFLKPVTQAEKIYGLSAEKMEEVRRKGYALRGRPKDWWRSLDASFERYTSIDGREGWFLTEPVPETLTEDTVISVFYHASFHQAVPGILTALGLLATFVAILMALSGVTYNPQDPSRPVSGIDTLINGLSGKFLSSIIALILSVIFTFVEKKICERQIFAGYDDLVKRCRDIFPFLSQSRILLDIQRLTWMRARAEDIPEPKGL